MKKSGIIIRVWSKPFFLIHVQKSGIIIQVWAHPFLLFHLQKSGIFIQLSANPLFLVHMQKSGLIIRVWTESFFLIHMHRCQPLRFFRNCYEFRARITVLRSTVYLLRISDYCWPETVPNLNIIVII